MATRLQFFSKPYELEGDEYGYDGSMIVESFDKDRDLQEYAKRMDCIFGPALCIVTQIDYFGPGRDRVIAIQFERERN